MVTCATGFDAKSDVLQPYGMCQCVCGTSLCDLSISNTCDSGVCKCGTATQCDTTSTIPACLSLTGTTPDWGDSDATCKVGYISQSLRYRVRWNEPSWFMIFYFVFQFSAKQEHAQTLKLTHATLLLVFASADLMQHVVVMSFGDVKTIQEQMLNQKITIILQRVR